MTRKRPVDTSLLLLATTMLAASPLFIAPARADFIPGDVVISASTDEDVGEVAGLQVGQPIVVNGTTAATAAVADGSQAGTV